MTDLIARLYRAAHALHPLSSETIDGLEIEHLLHEAAAALDGADERSRTTDHHLVVLPPDHHLVPTGPTHLLLVPFDTDCCDSADLPEVADRLRSQLPHWLTAKLVPGMRGEAVMIPIAGPTPEKRGGG